MDDGIIASTLSAGLAFYSPDHPKLDSTANQIVLIFVGDRGVSQPKLDLFSSQLVYYTRVVLALQYRSPLRLIGL